VGNYLSYFLNPYFAFTAAIAVAVALVVTIVFRARFRTVGRRLCFFLTAVSLSGIIRLTLLREPAQGPCLSCLTQWSADRLIAGNLANETALNIALFVPLGLFATLMWKAPFRVTGIAALISLAIEITQPLLGTGANDLTDLVANTLGAFLGAGVATAILLVRDAATSRRIDWVRLAKFAAVTVVTVGLGLGLSIGGANAIQASGTRQLEAVFAGTTLADYRHNQTAWNNKFDAFWKANRQPTNDAYEDGTVALQRFTWHFYWTTRCTIARWDSAGFTTQTGSGDDCTERLP
jgi:glycopeptide antibiotics resistance protein